jgi:hypothetical protein
MKLKTHLSKLLFPTRSDLQPKSSVVVIDRVPRQLLAFFKTIF